MGLTKRNGISPPRFSSGFFTMTLDIDSMTHGTPVNPVTMTRAEMFASVHNDILSFITNPSQAMGEENENIYMQFNGNDEQFAKFLAYFASGCAQYFTDIFSWNYRGHYPARPDHYWVICDTIVSSYNMARELFGSRSMERIAAFISGQLLATIEPVKFIG